MAPYSYILNDPLAAGLVVHGGIAFLSLRYAIKQIRAGQWQILCHPMKAGVYHEMFLIRLKLLHWSVCIAGCFYLGGEWFIAAFCVLIGHWLLIKFLALIGVIRNVRRRPGPVDEDGALKKKPDERKDKGKDDARPDSGKSRDW